MWVWDGQTGGCGPKEEVKEKDRRGRGPSVETRRLKGNGE